MFPILYENIERDISAVEAPKLIVPQHYGLGVLSDCISCEAEQTRNGIYELVMEYSASGIHASEIANRRLLKVKPNPTDDPQLFRIDRIGKTMNGRFTCYAKHISYDISGYEIISGTAINAVDACVLLEGATNEDFKIHTTKGTVADFKITEPASVKSWFAGRQGSFIDTFGQTEIKYDNFDVKFMQEAGQDRGVTIRYGKNLLELSQEMDSSNLYTHLIVYYKTDEITITSDKQATGLSLDVPKTLVLDVTSEFQEAPTKEQLNTRALQYINANRNKLTIPSNNITLDFVQSGDLTNRVDLCDTVSVYYEALGITRAEVKCIRTKYDCLREKYIETEFGDAKQNLADTISNSTAKLNDAVSTADAAMSAVGSKKRVFVTEPVPPYDIGDLWIDGNDIKYCAEPKAAGEQYELSDWLLASDYVDESHLEQAIKASSALITGGSGGNIVILRTPENPDGTGGIPYELVIFKTANPTDPQDLDHAKYVWRWNINGLAYSGNGYNSENYYPAITSDGKIVANRILTGELDAGEITVKNLTASMFKGQTINLGGVYNQSGILKIYDQTGSKILVQMDANGIECFGETSNNITPSVVFDKYGVTGYSNSDPVAKPTSKIFWTNKDSFQMKNGVVENQLSIGGKMKLVPFTIKDGNGNIIDDGIAEVPIL